MATKPAPLVAKPQPKAAPPQHANPAARTTVALRPQPAALPVFARATKDSVPAPVLAPVVAPHVTPAQAAPDHAVTPSSPLPSGSTTPAPARRRTPNPTPPRIEPPRGSAGLPGFRRLVSSPLVEGGGEPLAPEVKPALERSFDVNLDLVRVHTDGHANTVAETLGARAFAYGNHIFLGAGESKTDLGLLAHETAHVVQQQSVAEIQLSAPGRSDAFEYEAERASAAVVRGDRFDVTGRVSRPRVQRSILSRILDRVANWAYNIPGFRLLTIIIGRNPINMEVVDRSAANILRGLVELIPGGHLIEEALDQYHVFDRLGGWLTQQINRMESIGHAIRQDWDNFVDGLSWTDIRHPGQVLDDALGVFRRAVTRVGSFALDVGRDIVRFIKDAILMPLARLASQTRGWDLLIAVLGRNPITGEPVPRTAENLIGGFMRLIGQEEIWQNIRRANAIPRAWAWFQGALEGVLGFVRQIPSLFIQALHELELTDIIVLPRAFLRVGRVFVGFALQFFSWAGQQVWSLLQIIFEVVAPGVMPYLRRAAGAFRTIIHDPIGFVRNLVRAGIQGFHQFSARFLTHLRGSLISWLTGTLEGANIYIPQGFTFFEIIKFVLSVLGLTWQNIRQKLVRRIGETAVRALEIGFDLVVTLVRDGPAAAWERIQEHISNLREMVMEQVMTFVRERIVQAAITRLVTSLNPAGAFIQAIIAIYNTIMFFVERLRQIAQVAASFIDSISAIANGVITTAADRVEQTMAGLLTLVISFLARLVGLGRVSDVIVNVVNRIRQPIDNVLERVVDWIVEMARRVGRFFAPQQQTAQPSQPGQPALPDDSFEVDGEVHRITVRVESGRPTAMIASDPMSLRDFLNRIERDDSVPADQKALVPAARNILTMLEHLTADAASGRLAGAELQTLQERIHRYEEQLAQTIQRILSGVDSNAADDRRYRGEGLVGSFSAMEGLQRGDRITPDHQPQNAVFIQASRLSAAATSSVSIPLFASNSNMAAHAASRSAAGLCINLHENRHMAGRTYGGRGIGTRNSAMAAINSAIGAFPVDVAKSPQEIERVKALQRREVIRVIRNEMIQDTNAMRSVVNRPENDPVWADIPNLPSRSVFDGRRVKKARLILRIRQQVLDGESQIESQDLDRLKY